MFNICIEAAVLLYTIWAALNIALDSVSYVMPELREVQA